MIIVEITKLTTRLINPLILINLVVSLVISTIIIYGINIIAGFAGADYTFSHGETFIVWILMAILINNCLKK